MAFSIPRFFFLLNEKSDPGRLEEKITQDYMQDHYMKQPFKLLTFKKSYLSSLTTDSTSATLHANMQSILLFSIVTFLILIISILNFVILFTSNHLGRIKEIGIKKVTDTEVKKYLSSLFSKLSLSVLLLLYLEYIYQFF